MPQVAVGRPFDELELPDEHRAEPSAFVHFLGGEPLSPSSRFRLREIGEWALCPGKGLESPEELVARCSREPASGASCIHQVGAVVVAEYDGVEVPGAQRVARD